MFFLIIILALLILLFLVKSSYKKDGFLNIDEKQYPLKKLYPMSQYIIDKILVNKKTAFLYKKYIWTKDKEDDLNTISIGEDKELINILWQCQKIAVLYLMLIIIIIFVLLLSYSSSQNKLLVDGQYLLRPSYGEGNSSILINAHTNGIYEVETYEYEIEIEERKYNEELVSEYFKSFCNEIESIVIGKNISLNEVKTNLTFPQFISDTKIPLKWSTSSPSIVNNKGIINREYLEENQIVEVTVEVKYMELEIAFLFFIEIIKKDGIEEIPIKDKINQYIESTLYDSKTYDKVELHHNIDGVEIKWEEVKGNKHIVFLIFGVTFMVLYLVLDNKQVELMLKKRDKQMLYDYSEIVSKLSMYLRAGMSLSIAWGRIVDSYIITKGTKRYAYEEMLVSYREMKLGESEIKVLEGFGRRVKLPCYLRFASLVSSNIQKGNSSLLNQLEYEVVEAFMERKEIIKRMGEEAGTKLLVPMMIMLVLVLAIIMIPAYLSFQL